MPKVTMRDMLQAGVHFGHQSRYWNPQMAPYIYGVREKVHIINLEKTLPMFQDVLSFVSNLAQNRGKLLFVGTKTNARDIIRVQARRCGMPYVNHRWLGGMLTNYKTIRQSIRRLKELEKIFEGDKVEDFTKKEQLQLQRERTKLDRGLGGIKDMAGLPDAIFIIDVGHENIAIAEAKRLRIPVIGIVDTNNSPDHVDFVVPGNDDSLRSIQLYSQSIADVIIEAQKHLAEIDAEQAKAKAKDKDKAKEKEKEEKTAAKRKVVTKAKKPITMATSTPNCFTSSTSLAIREITAGSMPY